MTGYTLDQMKTMGATPVAPPTTVSSGGGLTFEQLQQMGAQPTAIVKPKPANPIVSVATGAVDAVKKGVGEIGDVFHQNAAEQGVAPSIGGEIATGAELAGKITALPFEAIGGALGRIIPQGVKDAAAGVVHGAAEAVTSSPETVDALNKVNGLIDAHPHVAQLLSGLFNTAMNVGGADMGAGVAKIGTEGAVDAVKGVARSTSDMAEALGTGVADKVKGTVYHELPGLNPDREAAIKTIADDWAKPANTITPGFKRAGKVLAKDPETPTFLAEQGISPYAHIEDGKYVTEEAATTLRDRAGELSRKMLRPSLQMADYSTPRTAVSDVVRQAITEAKSSAEFGTTAGNEEAIIAHITDEGRALAAKFPEGMSLTDMLDNNIKYAKNGGFSPVNDPKVNNLATGNRSIAQTLNKVLEEKSPKEIPVKAFKTGQAKFYRAADYLMELNGKKVPVSLTQQVIRGVAKFTGAGIGAHLGGGVISEFAGYQLGKAVERMLENVSTPYRAAFLDNLAKTDPKAFQAVQDYITEKTTGSKIPLLKAAGPETPIPMGAPQTPPEPIVRPAKKTLPTQNPKTGRMQRTYTSGS